MQQTLRMAERVRIAHEIDVRRLALHPGAQVWIEGVAVRAAVPEELGNLDARLVGRYLHFADFLVLLALFKLCRRVRRRTCESGQRQGSGDPRSEERRVGNERVSTCISRLSASNYNKNGRQQKHKSRRQ